MPTWQGKDVATQLTDDEIIAAYNTCVTQETARQAASSDAKFTADREINGKTVKKLDFAPTNPAFLELKQALQTQIDKRGLKV